MQRFEQRTKPAELLRAAGISPVLAKLLCARGVCNEESMEAFLYPSLDALSDPFAMKDMDKAVARIARAVQAGERICIYGDYDVDGVCAVSILFRYLRALEAHVSYYIPSRHEEGYGMRITAVEKLAREGTQLIVTVDNGIKSQAEVAHCYVLGMEVVVTDHHLCEDTLPACEAVLCHTRPDNGNAGKDLCGAGTAWKLVMAMAGLEAAKTLIPFAGIATVADIVPLLGENRIFVAEALRMMNERECQVGIEALGRLVSPQWRFNARSIGYGLGPRLNAAGRLGDAAQGVQLLCTDDPEEAERIAEALDERNRERREEEQRICDALFAELDAADLSQQRGIARKGDWNPGVIGVAASRVAERYTRPTILFSEKDGLLQGSARSIAGVNLYAAIERCTGHLIRFGGHEAAAGATMEGAEFPAFQNDFDTALREIAPDETFVPRAFYELEMDFASLNMELALSLERLEPFGEGNPTPLFLSSDVRLQGLRRMGDGSHLKATCIQGASYFEAVMFGMGARMDEFLDMDHADILYTPRVNELRGERSLQLQIVQVRPCAPAEPLAYLARHKSKFADAFSKNILYNNMVKPSCPIVSPKDWIEIHMDGGIAGALLICFSPQGAAAFLQDYGERKDLCPHFFTVPDTPCAYNALLFAPILDGLCIHRYRHILIMDSPVSAGIEAKLRGLAPKAEIVWGGLDGRRELLEPLRLDRAALGAAYRCLRGETRPFYNEAEAADRIAAGTDFSLTSSRLCFQVMGELGFLARDPKRGLSLLAAPPKRALEESPTFSMTAALWEMAQ